MHPLSTAVAAGVLFLSVDRLVARRAAVLAVVVLLSLPWRPLGTTGHACVRSRRARAPSTSWLPVRRSAAMATVAAMGGLVLRVKGR